jgi:hypothetical protein
MVAQEVQAVVPAASNAQSLPLIALLVQVVLMAVRVAVTLLPLAVAAKVVQLVHLAVRLGFLMEVAAVVAKDSVLALVLRLPCRALVDIMVAAQVAAAPK